jgi:hypothetical protein
MSSNRIKEPTTELTDLYHQTTRAFNGGVDGVFVCGQLTVVLVERKHFAPDIYVYNFKRSRKPLIELGNAGQSLLFRPYSKEGVNGDIYLNEEDILKEMRLIPKLMKERVRNHIIHEMAVHSGN